MPNASPTTASVPTTATITLKRVTVLTLHPNGLARNSHRSLDPRGQISGEVMGAKIGRREWFGTQVEDFGVVSKSLNRFLGYRERAECRTGIHSNTSYMPHPPPNTGRRSVSASKCGKGESPRPKGLIPSPICRGCRSRCYTSWGYTSSVMRPQTRSYQVLSIASGQEVKIMAVFLAKRL